MRIGDWKATRELTRVYRKARELGIETNLAELEAFGFTVIEAEIAARPASWPGCWNNQAPARRREQRPGGLQHQRAGAGCRRTPSLPPDRQGPGVRRGRGQSGDADAGPVPYGRERAPLSTVAFVKAGHANPTLPHSDSVAAPPRFTQVCNLSWILTDYTVENGTFAIVPGRHRYWRDPTFIEQPKRLGSKDKNMRIRSTRGPVRSSPSAATPARRLSEAERCEARPHRRCVRAELRRSGRVSATCRLRWSRHGPDTAQLLGRNAWQGHGSAGPEPPDWPPPRACT